MWPTFDPPQIFIDKYSAMASGRVSIEDFKKKQLYISGLQSHIEKELTNFDAFVR